MSEVQTNWFRGAYATDLKWHAAEYVTAVPVTSGGTAKIYTSKCGYRKPEWSVETGDGIEPPEDAHGVCKRCLVYLESDKRVAEATERAAAE